MTDLIKPIKRVTRSERFSRGKHRRLIVSLEPGDVIGVRLQGTRQTYRLSIEAVYERAILAHVSRVEKRTKELKKTGLRSNTARARARKELEADLKAA